MFLVLGEFQLNTDGYLRCRGDAAKLVITLRTSCGGDNPSPIQDTSWKPLNPDPETLHPKP